jgi:hypothetical protein
MCSSTEFSEGELPVSPLLNTGRYFLGLAARVGHRRSRVGLDGATADFQSQKTCSLRGWIRAMPKAAKFFTEHWTCDMYAKCALAGLFYSRLGIWRRDLTSRRLTISSSIIADMGK